MLLMLPVLLQCSRWRLMVMVGYCLDLVQQGGHVERLRDSWLTMGNTLTQKLINHLHTHTKGARLTHKSHKILTFLAHLIFQGLAATMTLEC